MLSEEQIIELILRRLYLGTFTELDWGIDLNEFAEKHGIDRETCVRVFEKIEERNLAKNEQAPIFAEPTTQGLIYVEVHGLVEQELIDKQN